MGSDRASVSSSIPSSYSSRRGDSFQSQQISAYLQETDSYRAFLCQGPQGTRTCHTTLHNGSSCACQDQPEKTPYDSCELALAQYRTLDESQTAPWYVHSDPGSSCACRDQQEKTPYDGRELALAQYRTLNESQTTPRCGNSDPAHNQSPCDGRNSGEASPEYNVFGHLHHRPTRYDGHDSNQPSTDHSIPGGPAHFQSPAPYGNVCPPHMMVPGLNNSKATMNDGILYESRGPPPYEVAIRSQPMAEYVQDWSMKWNRMERGRGGDSGNGGRR